MGRTAQTVAPAKVNLYLGVHTERDERGYHRVTSLMVALDLVDDVRVSVSDATDDSLSASPECTAERIAVVCEPAIAVQVRDNLAWRAAHALRERLGRTDAVHIELHKRIPAQAGLGGGSSDAAAVLRCLAALWSVNERDLLASIARDLGADVPFFLQDRPCLLEGAGDIAVRTFNRIDVPLVLVRPDVGVSTAEAYRTFDRLKTPAPALDDLVKALETKDPAQVVAKTANNLTPAACELEPAIAQALAFLAHEPAGIAAPLLCGSGSACALFVRDDEATQAVVQNARAQGLWACAAHTASQPWANVHLGEL